MQRLYRHLVDIWQKNEGLQISVQEKSNSGLLVCHAPWSIKQFSKNMKGNGFSYTPKYLWQFQCKLRSGFPNIYSQRFLSWNRYSKYPSHAYWPAAVRMAACWQNKGSKTVINQIVGVKNNINGPDEAWDMRLGTKIELSSWMHMQWLPPCGSSSNLHLCKERSLGGGNQL